MKRLFDITVSLTIILVGLPFSLLFLALILIVSGRPVFQRHSIAGKNDKEFNVYQIKNVFDNRKPKKVKGFCFFHLLRIPGFNSLSLFFQVLKGNMSIIGPHAEITSIVDKYSAVESKVLKTKPGIIGPAQILGGKWSMLNNFKIRHNNPDYMNNTLPELLKYDLDYIKKTGFWYDIKMLVNGFGKNCLRAFKPETLHKSTGWPTLFVLDSILIIGSYFLAYCLRFDWSIPEQELVTFLYTLPVVYSLRSLSFLLFKLYNTFYKYTSIKDLILIVKATLSSTGMIVVIVFFLDLRVHSRSIFIIDWILLLLAMGGIRVLLRILSEKMIIKQTQPIQNLLIIGAGDVGELVARDISKNGHCYRIVGFIDDDRKKIGKRIHGIKVVGNRHDIYQAVKAFHVDELLIAINKISSEEMREILDICKKNKIRHRVVPAVADLVSGKIHLSKIRKVNISDLLGREPLKLDLNAIKTFLTGKRILVTGAGGSIGSELSRQIIEYNPSKLILLDRNENYLYEVACDLAESQSGQTKNIEYIVGDVLDNNKTNRLFSLHKPQIVFHAAAQKHVPLSESNPDEAVKNNVIGTQIMALYAHRYAVQHFVLISTDKAVNPTSIMGATKRVIEKFIYSLSKQSKTIFVTVRFGNVLNSHGSVVPLFLKQIQNGGPITLTDPKIERFFMSIPEAVNLILQAITMGKSGEIYILNMGRLIRISELAHEMIKQTGLKPDIDIKIKYTGLRPGEKMYEELVGMNEIASATEHDLIKKINQVSGDDYKHLSEHLKNLRSTAKYGDKLAIIDALRKIVPEYHPTIDLKIKDQKFTKTVKETSSGKNKSQILSKEIY